MHARISLRVSPAVGPIDEDAAVGVLRAQIPSDAKEETGSANLWRDAIRVVRQEPQETRAGKVLAFHTLR